MAFVHFDPLSDQLVQIEGHQDITKSTAQTLYVQPYSCLRTPGKSKLYRIPESKVRIR